MSKGRLRLSPGIPGRNTPAYEIDLGPHSLYVSYQTVIGYRGPAGSFRRDNVWGPTTGRHINEMGLRNLEVLDEDAFNARVAKSIGYDVS